MINNAFSALVSISIGLLNTTALTSNAMDLSSDCTKLNLCWRAAVTLGEWACSNTRPSITIEQCTALLQALCLSQFTQAAQEDCPQDNNPLQTIRFGGR